MDGKAKTSEQLMALALAVENAINEPWTGAGMDEPLLVRDYRHWLYRVWSPLAREIATPTPQEGEK